MNEKTSRKNLIPHYTLLCFFVFFLITVGSQPIHAWDNCPFGEVDEPYPGTCWRYIDTDQDNICDLSQSSPEDRTINTNDVHSESNNTTNQKSITTINSSTNYYFIPIAVLLFISYIVTHTMSKKKKITVSKHRNMWNIILLVTFVVSGFSGLILAILISYGIRLSFYSDLLFWHVETGIAMAILSLFHIIWHRRYFKRLFTIIS